MIHCTRVFAKASAASSPRNRAKIHNQKLATWITTTISQVRLLLSYEFWRYGGFRGIRVGSGQAGKRPHRSNEAYSNHGQ